MNTEYQSQSWVVYGRSLFSRSILLSRRPSVWFFDRPREFSQYIGLIPQSWVCNQRGSSNKSEQMYWVHITTAVYLPENRFSPRDVSETRIFSPPWNVVFTICSVSIAYQLKSGFCRDTFQSGKFRNNLYFLKEIGQLFLHCLSAMLCCPYFP